MPRVRKGTSFLHRKSKQKKKEAKTTRQINKEIPHLDNETIKEEMQIDETIVDLGKVKEEPLEIIDGEENNLNTNGNDSNVNPPITVFIKEEFDKIENPRLFYCDVCATEFKLFCPKCSMVSYILDNIKSEVETISKGTLPKSVLKIKQSSNDVESVLSLVIIPKDVIFGPYQGIESVTAATGHKFIMKKENLLKIKQQEYSNWLQYVKLTDLSENANLTVFQCEGYLYYQSTKEIVEDEELLVYYGDTFIKESDENDEKYFTPIVIEKIGEIHPCMACSLGFASEAYLHKHLVQCPNKELWDNTASTLFKSIEPPSAFCETSITEPALTNEKPLKCPICEKGFKFKHGMRNHINIQHTREEERQIFKCTKCSFQTYHKRALQTHEYTHQEVKPFQCEMCQKSFIGHYLLRLHVKNQHSKDGEKDYKCTKCDYQTNYKQHLKLHLYKHETVKPYQCHMCGMQFIENKQLAVHIKHKHTSSYEKEHKCPKCTFETDYKYALKIHLYKHDESKPFICNICNKSFIRKDRLEYHIRDKHMKDDVKNHQCPHCSYETNQKSNMTRHLSLHDEVKKFQCHICYKQLSHRHQLKMHIKNEHYPDDKDFKCSQCSYQSNYKQGLVNHIEKHKRNVDKNYKCLHCAFGTNYRDSLRQHLIKQHSESLSESNTIEDDD